MIVYRTSWVVRVGLISMFRCRGSTGSFIEVSDLEEEVEDSGSVEEEEVPVKEDTQQGGSLAETETDEVKPSQETRAETSKGEWEHVDLVITRILLQDRL